MKATIVNELHDIIEKPTHCVGWRLINNFEDIDRFLCIYTHQTHTVYTTRSTTIPTGKLLPLPYAQWTYDNQLQYKYYKQIKSIRYDCQRSCSSQ